MKILSIGDIHGKVSQKWISFIKKEKFDVVVCNGDYFPFTYSKLWFEKCFGTDSELWEIIGEEKYCEAVLNDLKKGAEAIKKLDSLNIPILTVLGNHDESKANVSPDTIDSKEERNERDKEENGFLDKILAECKNIKRIDYSYAKQGQFIFIGMNGGSFPGYPKSKAYKKVKRNWKKFSKNLKKRIKKEE